MTEKLRSLSITASIPYRDGKSQDLKSEPGRSVFFLYSTQC